MPIAIVSFIPFIILNGKISYLHGMSGETLEVGRDDGESAAITLQNKLIAAGISFNFSKKKFKGVI